MVGYVWYEVGEGVVGFVYYVVFVVIEIGVV